MEFLRKGLTVAAAGLALTSFLSTAVGGQTNSKNSKRQVTISCGVCNRKAILLPKPEYPESAKFLNIQGPVIVRATIGEYGNVVSAKVISGHPFFHQSCKRAALRAKFSATFLGGKRVRVSTTIVYNFSR